MYRLRTVEIRINDTEKFMFPETILEYMPVDVEKVKTQFRHILLDLVSYLNERKIKVDFTFGSPWLDEKLVSALVGNKRDFDGKKVENVKGPFSYEERLLRFDAVVYIDMSYKLWSST